MTERLAPDAAGIARGAALLREGQLVAFATETVYGLGADATNPQAVAALFAVKGRPSFNPLIIHFHSSESAFRHVEPTPLAEKLGRAFWPGPLTLVLPRRPDTPIVPTAGAGLPTLAVRVPRHPAALALIQRADRPIAAPSANVSGRVSPTTADHVLEGLNGRIAAVIDSGPTSIGVESTVLDLSGKGPRLLRPGGLTAEVLRAFIGEFDLQVPKAGEAPRAPGALSTHYAPLLPVRLDAQDVAPNEALLAFGEPLPGAGLVFNLSDAEDVVEAAARLFAGLRYLDEEGRRLGLIGIAVMPVPASGLGLAIIDRLTRAATRCL